MREQPGTSLVELEDRSPDLCLLAVPESGVRVFFGNLIDFFRPSEKVPFRPLDSAAFWPDVFVERRLPWRRFFESGAYHVLALALVWMGSRFLVLRPEVIAQPVLTHADVIYYSPSEYLPPLDTRLSASTPAKKADPELAAQPIISVPREADNHFQTIVTPPNIRLRQDVALPNTVSWSHKPEMPIAPAPIVLASETSRLAPRMEQSLITPPPAIQESELHKIPQAPRAAVIAPAPELQTDTNRRVSDVNIASSAVIAPAPQLALDAQHITATGRRRMSHMNAQEVIAPPPAVRASPATRSNGNMIALSLHPAVGAPPSSIAGNRRGNFAATPEGHSGASGNPGSSVASSGTGAGRTSGKSSNLPAGLYVGKSPNTTSSVPGDPRSATNTVNPNLIARARPPRFSSPTDSESNISEAERAVFGERKVYSLSLNMPNLNSAGGSWIIRFAALKQDSGSGDSPQRDGSSGDLSSPVAMRKVDPAYPLELMRQNVAGTVILYGIIRSDGTVGSVHVLRSVDDRLDRFASEAIEKWRFRPATKNGAAVDVEATFWVPFRPARTKTDF